MHALLRLSVHVQVVVPGHGSVALEALVAAVASLSLVVGRIVESTAAVRTLVPERRHLRNFSLVTSRPRWNGREAVSLTPVARGCNLTAALSPRGPRRRGRPDRWRAAVADAIHRQPGGVAVVLGIAMSLIAVGS